MVAPLTRPLPVAEALAIANAINECLHRAKIPKEDRAAWLAMGLLAIESGTAPDETAPDRAYLEQLSRAGTALFKELGAEELWASVRPETRTEGASRTAGALREMMRFVREQGLLEHARSSDLLGAFFEAFLRYGNTGRDLGIALTPAHLCRFAADALEVGPDDEVYDPAVGTGGFLVAACQRNPRTKTPRLRGAEVSGPVGALAAINLHLRGADGSGLSFGSCFDAPRRSTATRALMNPPFSLKDARESESDFVDLALEQLRDDALLFAVLPASVMYDAKNHAWRQRLLGRHTLMSVLLLPVDLFYPVATECVAIVLRARSAHPSKLPVLWGRMRDDGFVKRKGARVERAPGAAEQALAPLARVLCDWAVHGQMGTPREGEYEFAPVASPELIPQAHLGTPRLDARAFEVASREAYRAIVMQGWQQGPGADEELAP